MVGNSTVSNEILKQMHVIIIVDESGSMCGNWASVSATVDEFIKHFAEAGSDHLFSVVLFDNSCRYHAKKERAINIPPLPPL